MIDKIELKALELLLSLGMRLEPWQRDYLRRMIKR